MIVTAIKEARQVHNVLEVPEKLSRSVEAKKTKEKAKAHSKKFYCPICQREYKKDEDWIACDICDNWLDRACAGLTEEDEWDDYSMPGNEYTCPMCRYKC